MLNLGSERSMTNAVGLRETGKPVGSSDRYSIWTTWVRESLVKFIPTVQTIDEMWGSSHTVSYFRRAPASSSGPANKNVAYTNQIAQSSVLNSMPMEHNVWLDGPTNGLENRVRKLSGNNKDEEAYTSSLEHHGATSPHCNADLSWQTICRSLITSGNPVPALLSRVKQEQDTSNTSQMRPSMKLEPVPVSFPVRRCCPMESDQEVIELSSDSDSDNLTGRNNGYGQSCSELSPVIIDLLSDSENGDNLTVPRGWASIYACVNIWWSTVTELSQHMCRYVANEVIPGMVPRPTLFSRTSTRGFTETRWWEQREKRHSRRHQSHHAVARRPQMAKAASELSERPQTAKAASGPSAASRTAHSRLSTHELPF
ncbi:hypothetical protein C8R45DRAFT_1134476 [Mycena sanguinolenta]|nr:hypothetical protein C8R45DRAFT_1134476 [Mycena sanguinolenta]